MKHQRNSKGEPENSKIKVSFFRRHTGLRTFLISFLICAIVFCAIVYAVLSKITPKAEPQSATAIQSVSDSSGDSSSVTQKAVSFSAADSFTMLTVVYAANDGTPVQFMLYRLDTSKKRTVVLSLPPGLYVNNSTLSDTYLKGGVNAAANAVSSLISKKIDFTASVSSVNFAKMFSTLGGVYYSVPENITYTIPDDYSIIKLKRSAKQYLNGTKMYALIGYYSNSGIMTRRCGVQTDIMKEFLSEKLTGYYLDRADTYFSDIFNMVNTDFSMNDLIKRTDELKALSASNAIVVPPVTFVAMDNIPAVSSSSSAVSAAASSSRISSSSHSTASSSPRNSSSRGSSSSSRSSSASSSRSSAASSQIQQLNPVDKTLYRISSLSALNGYF